MTPASTDVVSASPVVGVQEPIAPTAQVGSSLSGTVVVKLLVTLTVAVCYYAFRADLVELLLTPFEGFLKAPIPVDELTWYRSLAVSLLEAMPAWLAASLLFSLLFLWRKEFAKAKAWHAPLLVTSILIMGDAGFSFLELHHRQLMIAGVNIPYVYTPTFVAIFVTVMVELIVGRFFWGKWPHLASAFVSGISAGILIKSSYLWPFVMCGMISITSKYVLRIGGRHIWNPTNFGVTMMLFLAPQYLASLSVEAGNEVWAALVIWCLGGMILYRLGLFHIPVAFVATWVPLAFFRSWLSGESWLAEIAPITSPMFQLYIFFMITDPKTITKQKWSQILVAVLVAVAETAYRIVPPYLGAERGDVHSLYHALFTVGPIANLIEIAWTRRAGQAPAR